MLGNTRTIDIGYEITVANHRYRPAAVSVRDHLPVSTDGDIEGEAAGGRPPRPRRMSPASSAGGRWSAPRESAAVRHRFTVEHPAQVTVTGL